MTRFVADSSIDIKEIPGVEFVSAPLTIYTDEVSYTDDEQLNITEMLDYLAGHKGRSYTACPSVDSWLQAFGGADTVYVCAMTSTLSGTYNSAVAAREMYLQQHPQAKVHVFDSLTTGPELCILMEKVIELSQSGLPFEEVCRQAEEYSKRLSLLFALKSVHNLAQNGRVNKLLASALGVLGINIISKASEQGDIEPIGKCRGDKKLVNKMVEEMEAMNYQGGKVRIAHVENQELAEQIAVAIRKKYPQASPVVAPSGGLCSYYAERGGILIGFE